MTTPHRVQRRRTKGWRMPANTIYVGRGTRWGNPWRVGHGPIDSCLTEPQRRAVTAFKAALAQGFRYGPNGQLIPTLTDIRTHLKGKNLACWCPLTQPCHADVLLAIANNQDKD